MTYKYLIVYHIQFFSGNDSFWNEEVMLNEPISSYEQIANLQSKVKTKYRASNIDSVVLTNYILMEKHD